MHHPYPFRFRAHSYAFTVTDVFYTDVDATVSPRFESAPSGDERSEIVQGEFEVLAWSGFQQPRITVVTTLRLRCDDASKVSARCRSILRHFNRCASVAHARGLRRNHCKMKALLTVTIVSTFVAENSDLEQVRQFSYLRTIIAESGRSEKEIRTRFAITMCLRDCVRVLTRVDTNRLDFVTFLWRRMDRMCDELE